LASNNDNSRELSNKATDKSGNAVDHLRRTSYVSDCWAEGVTPKITVVGTIIEKQIARCQIRPLLQANTDVASFYLFHNPVES